MNTGVNRVGYQTVVLGGQVTHIPTHWYHTERLGQYSHFPHRIGNHITPLVCGLETNAALWQAIENAESSIEISLWGFDPALMMGGYHEDIEKACNLGASLAFRDAKGRPRSPRLGDLLLHAFQTGRKIRILHWDMGELLCNPYRILRYFPKNPITPADCARLIAGKWLDERGGREGYGEKFPSYGEVRDMLEGDSSGFFGWATPNWRYRYLWWKTVTENRLFPVLRAGVSPASVIPDAVKALIIYTFGLTRDYDETAPFLSKVVRAAGPSHHQKIVLADYENPKKAVGFVMGQNTRLVDSDSFRHPADAPFCGGRYPNEPPRQDISARIRGPVLHDVNSNFMHNWITAGGEDFRKKTATPEQYAFFEAPLEKPYWPAQFSVTRLGDQEPGCIKDAYDRAIESAVNYCYFENQYFRFRPLIAKMKDHAAKRLASRSHEMARPLYYFIVMDMPGSLAQGTTYETLKDLGHEQQMPAEHSRRYEELIRERDAYRNRLPAPPKDDPKLVELNKKIDAMEAESPVDLSMGDEESAGYPDNGPKNVENPEDSFAVRDIPGLKGFVATMMVCKRSSTLGIVRDSYEYKYVNIHSKLALFDDVFAIIGSANLNVRGMAGDNEAVIGTTQLGLASALRRRLFTGLLGTDEYNDKPVEEMYEAWEKTLQSNWQKQYRKQALQGTLTYVYDQTHFALPDLD